MMHRRIPWRVLVTLAASLLITATALVVTNGKALAAGCTYNGKVYTFCTPAYDGTTTPDGNYYVYNNTWNTAEAGPQTLRVNSQNDWMVSSNQPALASDPGSVKTYPEVQKNYPAVPLSSFSSITSSYTESMGNVVQGTTDAEAAYDIWLGTPTSATSEIMIWTQNAGQSPGGSLTATNVAIGGQNWDLYSGGGTYFAFVPHGMTPQSYTSNTSGSVDVLATLLWLVHNGYINANSTTNLLKQINYGWEICVTPSTGEDFTVSSFAVNDAQGGQTNPYPQVQTNAATSVAATSATVNGTVNPEGAATTYKFDYGTTNSYGSSTTAASAGSGTADVPETANLTGLHPDTVYHYRVEATNANGTQFGNDRTFTTPPSSGCGTANSALNDPATASSQENNGEGPQEAFDGDPNTRWGSAFSDPQWLQVDLGSPQPICQVNISWQDAYAKGFQIQVSNDASNWTTAYSTTTGTGGTQSIPVNATGRYVRMYGTTRFNTQWGYSIYEMSVNLGSGGGGTQQAPVVTTSAATNVTGSGATLNGSVNPQGAATSYQFDYGPTASYGSVTPAGGASAGSGSTAVNESAALSGLAPGTTEHYRVEATNSAGTTLGADQQFTTSAAPVAPVVTTTAATGVTSSGATLNGTVNPEGQAATYQFEYGPTTAYGTTSPAAPGSAGSGSTAVNESSAVTGLSASTTYHYRLNATNATGTTHSSDGTFTTPASGGGSTVAFDAAGGSKAANTSSLTWTQVVGSGANRAILADFTIGVATDAGCSATVTDNGKAMTEITAVHSDNQRYGVLVVYGLVNPPSGTNTIAASVRNCSGGTPQELTGGSESFTGVSQAMPIAWPHNIGYGYSGTTSVGVADTSASDMVGEFAANGSAINTPVSPTVQKFLENEDNGTGAGNTAGGYNPGANGTVTGKWSVDGDWWGAAAVVIPRA